MKAFFAFILLVGISYATDPCENGVCANDHAGQGSNDGVAGENFALDNGDDADKLEGVLQNWADSKGDDARDTMKKTKDGKLIDPKDGIDIGLTFSEEDLKLSQKVTFHFNDDVNGNAVIVEKEMPVKDWVQSTFLMDQIIIGGELGKDYAFTNKATSQCVISQALKKKCQAIQEKEECDKTDGDCLLDYFSKCKPNTNLFNKCLENLTCTGDDRCEREDTKRPLDIDAKTLEKVFEYMNKMGTLFPTADKENTSGGCFNKPINVENLFKTGGECKAAKDQLMNHFNILGALCVGPEKCGKLIKALNILGMNLSMNYIRTQMANLILKSIHP